MGAGALLKTLTGHKIGYISVSFSPDGRVLASGSWDQTVRLWDVGAGALLKTLTGHTNRVSSVSFSPDGRMLASRSVDNEVCLWDVRTGALRQMLTGHTNYVNSISFSPDGRMLASGDGDGTVRLWDVGTGAFLKTLTGDRGSVWGVSFSPDGRMLASGSGGTIRLWDVGAGEHLRTLEGHKSGYVSVSFSPDGRVLASGGGDSTVRLWDVGTGALLKTLTGHTDRVMSVSFSPDGRMLASGSDDDDIRLWDVGTGEHLRTLEGHKSGSWRGLGVTFSPDSTTLASSTSNDGTIRLWDVLSGQHKQTLRTPCRPMGPPVFSPDGDFLAVADGFGGAVLLNLAIGEVSEPIGYHPGLPEVVAFSPDGRTLATGGMKGTVLLWDVTSYTSQPSQPDSQYPQRNSVRLVYFRPSDRTSPQDIDPPRNVDAKLNALIKNVQDFYAAQLHRHGRKTFTFETDAEGKAVVHHVEGQFTDTYYQQHTYERVQKEMVEQFDTTKHVYLVAVDVSSEKVNSGDQGEVCGIGGGRWQSTHGSEAWKRDGGGLAVIPASGDCFTVGVTAHELGHTFGLEHDFRDETYLMGYGSQSKLSEDAADWLSVHRYFNTGQTALGPDTTLAVLSSRAFALKFQVSDADGLHQVQLLIPATGGDPVSGMKLHSSKVLNSETDSTVAFNVPGLTGDSEVTLQVIDMHGHITKQTFPVETDGITEVPEVPVSGDVARVRLSPASAESGNIDDQLTVNANIADGVDVRGYQVELTFDTAALRYVFSADGGYLPAGAFQVPPVIDGNRVTFGATSLQGSSEGDGTLATFTFEVLTTSPAMPTLSDVKLTDSNADFLAVRIESGEITDSPQLAGDVNGDGVVDLADITAAAVRLGQTGENTADMNGDGVVDGADLLLIAAAIEAAAAAPSLHPSVVSEMFTATEVRQWLSFARAAGLTGPMYQRGFLLLEQLLFILTPKETVLLANYPNPFNPETWIPYQLSESADVTISIYTTEGRLVRVLSLGHQGVGIYESRGRAAWWDGRNALGEPVASGVYFYTFTAGEFTATRKMLIRK